MKNTLPLFDFRADPRTQKLDAFNDFWAALGDPERIESAGDELKAAMRRQRRAAKKLRKKTRRD